MSESEINLDELLNKSEPIEESAPIQESTEASPEVSQEDDSAEDQGGDIIIEDTESQNNEVLEDNITEVQSEESIDSEEEVVVQDTIFDDELPAPTEQEEPTEYQFKDDFIKKAVEYYEKYGTLQPYLEATTTDYDGMSDLDVLKMRFDAENSDLSDRAKAKLFEREVEKYNLEAFDEEDLEVGQALLKRDANKVRAAMKEQQQQFIQSIQPASAAPQISQEELEAQIQESRKVVEKGISGVVKNNLIKLEANGEGINFQIGDTTKVVDYALDSTKFLSTFSTKDGQVDWDKWTKVVAFAENPTLFVSELIKHGKSIGRKSMEAELRNVSPTMRSKDVIETNDFVSPYDNPVDFLKGMTVRK
jgi:hypothetical protein